MEPLVLFACPEVLEDGVHEELAKVVDGLAHECGNAEVVGAGGALFWREIRGNVRDAGEVQERVLVVLAVLCAALVQVAADAVEGRVHDSRDVVELVQHFPCARQRALHRGDVAQQQGKVRRLGRRQQVRLGRRRRVDEGLHRAEEGECLLAVCSEFCGAEERRRGRCASVE